MTGGLKREDWRQHLRDLATKASPGPWSWEGDELVSSIHPDEFILHKNTESGLVTPDDVDAAWIAAASPSVVVALLDQIDALESTPMYCESSGEDEDPCKTCGASVDGGVCRALHGKRPT